MNFQWCYLKAFINILPCVKFHSYDHLLATEKYISITIKCLIAIKMELTIKMINKIQPPQKWTYIYNFKCIINADLF